MKIIFGEGNVSLTTAAHGEVLENNPSCMLFIEPDKGTGIVGGDVPDRKKGLTVDLEEYEKSETNIVFEFLNEESVDVMIEKLQLIKLDLKKWHTN